MERVDRTIAGRITVAVLAIHLFVLPMLYFAVVSLVRHSNEESFLNNVRIHTRFIADSLERFDVAAASDASVVNILDSVVLSGDGVYAELVGAGRRWISSLISIDSDTVQKDDFSFGDHGDSVYILSVPVISGTNELNLRLGFDETPVMEANEQAYRRGGAILAIYLTVVLALVALIGRRVVRPIKALQTSSRSIASGHLGEHLTVNTDLIEFVALARDLELMRNHLIGINRQLQEEIRQKEKTELERQQLEQQLRHRQRLETVGTLAGGIAHELNNIMVPILLYSESAMDDLPEDSPVKQDLQRVIRAAARARGIVQQVLTFSRQMGTLEVQAVDVAAVVRESLDLVRASFSPTVELQIDIDDGCPKVVGNASLLGQVVINLCTNAYQALQGGKGSIAVRVKKHVIPKDPLHDAWPGPDRTVVELMVQDSGEGMDDQTLERIFEPFFTTRKVGEGTGLGLAVVHGIVTNMDGQISVTSKPGRGTTFVVTIPANEPQDAVA